MCSVIKWRLVMFGDENEVRQYVTIFGEGGADKLLKARMSGVFHTNINNHLLPESNPFSNANLDTQDNDGNSKKVAFIITNYTVNSRWNRVNSQQTALVCVDLSKSRNDALDTMKNALQSAKRVGISKENIHIVALSDNNTNENGMFEVVKGYAGNNYHVLQFDKKSGEKERDDFLEKLCEQSPAIQDKVNKRYSQGITKGESKQVFLNRLSEYKDSQHFKQDASASVGKINNHRNTLGKFSLLNIAKNLHNGVSWD